MTSDHSAPGEEVVNLDQLERCESFDELKENQSFRQFIRILYRQRPTLFPADLTDTSEDRLVDYFARHPSIWREAEEFWNTEVQKAGKNIESLKAAQHISAHIRGLIASALQSPAVTLGAGQERGDVFGFNTRKNRPNRMDRSKFLDEANTVGNALSEMSFDLSPAIQAAKQSQDSDIGYTEVPDELFVATQEWLKKAHDGWEVDKEALIYMRDSLTSYQEAIKALVDDRSLDFMKQTREKCDVVMCTPIYGGLYWHTERALGKPPKTIPLVRRGGELTIDMPALSSTLRKGDVFVLCNPHNPGGHVYSRVELEEIKEICQEKQVKIIIDEALDGLVYNDKFVSLGSLYKEGEQNPTVTMVSTGKSFNVSDESLNMVVIPDENLQKAFKSNRIQGLPPTAIPNRVAQAAYTESDEWRQELLLYLEQNSKELYERINSDEFPGLSMLRPDGTYLAWIDASEAKLKPLIVDAFKDEKADESGEKPKRGPADYFAKVQNVAVANGSDFDVTGASDMCFRLNFAVPLSELREMLERIKAALPSEE